MFVAGAGASRAALGTNPTGSPLPGRIAPHCLLGPTQHLSPAPAPAPAPHPSLCCWAGTPCPPRAGWQLGSAAVPKARAGTATAKVRGERRPWAGQGQLQNIAEICRNMSVLTAFPCQRGGQTLNWSPRDTFPALPPQEEGGKARKGQICCRLSQWGLAAIPHGNRIQPYMEKQQIWIYSGLEHETTPTAPSSPAPPGLGATSTAVPAVPSCATL